MRMRCEVRAPKVMMSSVCFQWKVHRSKTKRQCGWGAIWGVQYGWGAKWVGHNVGGALWGGALWGVQYGWGAIWGVQKSKMAAPMMWTFHLSWPMLLTFPHYHKARPLRTSQFEILAEKSHQEKAENTPTCAVRPAGCDVKMQR